MSKVKSKGEKIQIVAFSTNESDHNPNDLINIYLENNNHIIIKKTLSATAFTTQLQNTAKQTKIMICSVLNLSKEYTGITDINCYLLYLDLEKEDSKSKFEIIFNYAKENCDMAKKFFVFGMISENKGGKYIKKEDIENYLNESQVNYEYKEINVSDKNSICDSFKAIFNYSMSHPLSGEIKLNDKDDDQSNSCAIF